MSGERAPLFGTDDDLDLSGFKPKPSPRPEQVRGIAESAGFRSRDAASSEIPRREPRRFRTGRNVQLNLKVRREAVEAFYKLADEQGWVLGEAFERAVFALQNSLCKGKPELPAAAEKPLSTR